MPFRFKKSDSPANALRRLCREHVRAALAALRKPESPEAVHRARKEIKKLRALFRLVRGEISAGTYRKGVKALRVAAECLGATRDARVMLQAFAQVAGHSAPQFAVIESALHAHARRAARQFQRDDSVARARRWLRKTRRCAGDLKIKTPGWGAVEPGLQQSYRVGRKACRLAQQQPAAENFHDWRKHVKDLWYYCGLLHPDWPGATRAMREALETLGEQLGQDHDLFLLQQFLAEPTVAPAGEADALKRLIAARLKRLRAAALKLGRRLYAETPARFCRRLSG